VWFTARRDWGLPVHQVKRWAIGWFTGMWQKGVETPCRTARGLAILRRVKLWLRLRVWAGSLRLDTRLAEGVAPTNSPELALRARQLADDRSRRALSSALTGAVKAARPPDGPWSRRTAIAAPAVRDAAEPLQSLARDLTTIDHPCVRGVALVSYLVCDPVSPLYSSHAPVTVEEFARRARSALRADGTPICAA
jgi:hypothetical protein